MQIGTDRAANLNSLLFTFILRFMVFERILLDHPSGGEQSPRSLWAGAGEGALAFQLALSQ